MSIRRAAAAVESPKAEPAAKPKARRAAKKRATPATARGRIKDARRNLYRDAILDAAERTFAESGYEATKVATIASVAGVSLMTFYSVFGKKWDVYRAVHAWRLEELMGHIGSRRLDKADIIGTLSASVASFLAFQMEHPEYLRMNLRERIAWTDTEGLRSSEQADAWNAGLAMMMSAFKAGIKQGIFVDDDPETMARTLVGMHQVRLGVWVERGQKQSPEWVVGAAIRQLIRSFCPPERVAELTARAVVNNNDDDGDEKRTSK